MLCKLIFILFQINLCNALQSTKKNVSELIFSSLQSFANLYKNFGYLYFRYFFAKVLTLLVSVITHIGPQ